MILEMLLIKIKNANTSALFPLVLINKIITLISVWLKLNEKKKDKRQHKNLLW